MRVLSEERKRGWGSLDPQENKYINKRPSLYGNLDTKLNVVAAMTSAMVCISPTILFTIGNRSSLIPACLLPTRVTMQLLYTEDGRSSPFLEVHINRVHLKLLENLPFKTSSGLNYSSGRQARLFHVRYRGNKEERTV